MFGSLIADDSSKVSCEFDVVTYHLDGRFVAG